MKEIERKPWVRWLDLTCAVIWLINLICKLSHYFQQLDQGVSMERLADARFDCVIAAFMAALGLVTFFLLHLPLQRLWSRHHRRGADGGGHGGLGSHLSPG